MHFGLFTLFDFFRDRQDEVAYYRDTLDLMELAERLGYDSVWVGEEHFYCFGICPSPQLFLTALARETSRLRLGTAISLLPFENPLRKAEDFAMLDILSGGRLNFGVGRGIIPKHFEGFRRDPREGPRTPSRTREDSGRSPPCRSPPNLCKSPTRPSTAAPSAWSRSRAPRQRATTPSWCRG